jgi:superfamily II DNA or RNA helicase
MIKLRPYQTELVNLTRSAMEDHNKIIVVAPTGAGKTIIFSYICQQVVKKGGKVLILCHRTKLIDQTVDKLQKFGLTTQKLTAGYKAIHKHVDCYVGMAQTLTRRKELPNVSLIIADECHISNFDKIIDRITNIKVLGFTATPWRMSKKNPLIDHYTKIVQSVDVPELIENSFLVPAEYYGFNESETALKIKSGEFTDASNIDYIGATEDLVNNYRKFADGERTMVFCVNIEHAKAVYHEFKLQGFNATLCHSKMSEGESDTNLDLFCAGVYDILINCGKYTAGFDDETVQAIIMARATKSLSLWLQICGRGSRPVLDLDYNVTGDKTFFKVIDLGGNIRRLGMWDQPRKWELIQPKDAEGLAPIKECPECCRVLHTSLMVCKCGYKFPPPKKKKPEGEIELILPIGKESYHKIMAVEKQKKEQGHKHGWLLHSLNRLELLEDFFILRNYSASYWVQLEKTYGIKRPIKS